MIKTKSNFHAEMQLKQKTREYQVGLMIGHYPLGYWSRGYVFGAFK